MSDDDRYATSYRFGPLERRSLVGSWRPGQVVAVGVACLVAMFAFRSVPSSSGFVLGLVLIGAGALVAFAPVAGRTLEQWVPLHVDWWVAKQRGFHRYRAVDPFAGCAGGSLPPAIDGCEVLSIPLAGGEELGVVRDAECGAHTAVLAVQMRALGLLAAAEQERRIVTWGRTLAGLSGERNAIRRIQLLERTVPCEPGQLDAFLDRHGSEQHTDARESYEQLILSAAHAGHEHELLVAIQVDNRRALRLAGAGGGTPDEQVTAALVREVAALAQRLSSDELTVTGALDAQALAGAIRLGFDPFRRRTAPVPSVSPTAADADWACARVDGALHRSYWVAEWPRTQVGPAFLSPLLLGVNAVRAVSVVFEPVPPGRSRAAVEAAITRDEADEQLRAERGFRVTARGRRQSGSARRREQELADGHEEMRFAGFVTVSGRDDAELAVACAEVEQAAQRAFLVLEPLWGQQDLGLTYAALPLARGLRDARPWSSAS